MSAFFDEKSHIRYIYIGPNSTINYNVGVEQLHFSFVHHFYTSPRFWNSIYIPTSMHVPTPLFWFVFSQSAVNAIMAWVSVFRRKPNLPQLDNKIRRAYYGIGSQPSLCRPPCALQRSNAPWQWARTDESCPLLSLFAFGRIWVMLPPLGRIVEHEFHAFLSDHVPLGVILGYFGNIWSIIPWNRLHFR